MENQIKTLIQIIKNTNITEVKKITNFITLEQYLDATKDKKLDSSLFEIFGYDDEDIFILDYNFLINNIY